MSKLPLYRVQHSILWFQVLRVSDVWGVGFRVQVPGVEGFRYFGCRVKGSGFRC